MILNDIAIRSLISDRHLLADYDLEQVRNCAYTLRAHSVFEPETGQQQLLDATDDSRRQHVWQIGPNETLVVMTRETIKMPSELCGSYAPLFRLAKQGLMLLNASIVEPGYEGPLSCFVANFSARPITLRRDAPIAKIVFHRMTGPPEDLKPEVISRNKYEEELAEDAQRYHRTFMDVTGIEERAAKQAKSEFRSLVFLGGTLIALLLAWASLEPILSKWIWEKTGLTSSTQRIEDIRLLKDIQNEQASLKSQLEQKKANDGLSTEIEDLRKQVRALQKK